MLKVKNLRARYEHFDVLKGIEFEISQGEIVAFLGSNAAGKSTTLLSLMGLVPEVQGEVDFMGESLLEKSTSERVSSGVVLVPEGRRIFPQMTVLENLQLGAYLRRDAEVDSDMKDVLERFPILERRAKQLAGTLSGGEQQMLAIGRALMARPKLLLLDEPSLGLAPILIEQIFEMIQEINEKGVTIFLVEQNARMALEISNRAYVLERGEISVSGKADELLNDEGIKSSYLG